MLGQLRRWRGPHPRARGLVPAIGLFLLCASVTACSVLGATSPASTPGVLPPGEMPPTATSTATSTATATAEPTPTPAPASQDCAAESIAQENLAPGTDAWLADHPLGAEDAIEAFTSAVSVRCGQSIQIYVSTTAASYTFAVYRIGWYQGHGARLYYQSGVVRGIAQPGCPTDPRTRMISCAWAEPVGLMVPHTWPTGVYVVKLLSSVGDMRYTSFTVRDDRSHSALLFTTSVLTYQAYNLWGGRSLYRGPDGSGGVDFTDRSYVVSFDRPYSAGDSDGLGQFGWYEYPLLRWIERNGFDVSYATDVDTDARGSLLLNHRLIVVAGHDEYWSTSMFAGLNAARDNGVSLAFFGANDAYWHIRIQPSALGADREVVCYKDATLDPLAGSDPQAATVRWQDPPLNTPENSLIGPLYGGAAQLHAPLVLADGARLFLRNTTLAPGSAFDPLVDGEFDKVVNNGATPAGLVILAASPVQCVPTYLCPSSGVDTANAAIYTAASGARVFDAGTFNWSWGLDDGRIDPRFGPYQYANGQFQQFTANLVADLLGVAAGG